ncbi:diguanylate cyclase/phosphodiesterase with PAS/PAC sensor(s) [Pseudonocardia thermophila]|uniref:Diguanylate cyclase/phosphodiesterase with PAS/PAC sensor(S) n=1 Tax=Pseudonocardia thermophila TaxID=1848 RepID=A0A1M6SC72_PSETH|nr:EAL domain-containing protein [Pseudonocardia thermophila]SHK42331.1 diguanylate cyclase/phosphodiesterase with PAS/PAC sensor(s) [Pseudonocardia thermophila]
MTHIHDMTDAPSFRMPQSPMPRVATERLARLAARWDAVLPGEHSARASRLESLLRRIAAAVRTEPFTSARGRAIGADLFAYGVVEGMEDPEDVLATSLTLLRAEEWVLLGTVDRTGSSRLAAVLAEVAAGFARAYGEAGADTPSTDPLADGIDEWCYRAGFEQAAHCIGLVSLDEGTLVGNPALRKLFGINGTDVPFTDFVHPDDLAEVLRLHQRLISGESEVVRADVRLVRPDLSVFWAHVIASMIRREDGAPAYVQTLVEDITERQSRVARLVHAAGRDQLTQLPGEAQAEKWLHRAFHGGSRTVGLCVVDLDGFSTLVDTLGSAGADRLLMAVAGRMQLVAGQHLLTRAGADQFLVLMADPENRCEPVQLADRLLDALSVPFMIGDRPVGVTASIGVAYSATASTTAAELTRAAEVACSWARSMGGGRRVEFDHRRDAGEAKRFALLSGLRGAIGRGEFRLAYQPLVSMDSRVLRGAEALVRWQHPDEGLIGPGRFIELAEQSGAIVPLGRWVLEEACAQAARWWHELGDDAPYVSVNVSPVQLASPDWIDDVIDILATTGLPPAKLQLEITEQAVLVDEATALASLTALSETGVRVALDDFGTGYSSFSWLRRLPVHMLKIDGSFIKGLREPSPDRVDRSIVKALIDMAHALELEVTAEWVETPVQVRRLTELGCDVGQGRWFGDPGPGQWVPSEFRRRLST